MARWGGRSGPFLHPLPGSRPDLMRRIWGILYGTEIDSISVEQLDDQHVVLLPWCYRADRATGASDEYEVDWGDGPNEFTSDLYRVWKTSAVHELIAADHPRLVRYDHADPFFRLPVLEMPSSTLERFLARNASAMYVDSRVRLPHRVLIYQWALHLISGLIFVHGKGVVFGDLRVEVCWLSNDLSLSLLGFLDAVYTPPEAGRPYINRDGRCEHEPFHPCHKPRHDCLLATPQTDLFVWACLVYQLMTGLWPGHDGQRSEAERRTMFLSRQWPVLETEYLGDILRKCWDYQYGDAEDLKADLVRFVNTQGWEVDGDEIRGFRAVELFPARPATGENIE